MTTLTITIDLDNAAFEDNESAEVQRILAEYAPRLDSLGVHHARPGETQELFSVRDYNGNTVGKFEVSA